MIDDVNKNHDNFLLAVGSYIDSIAVHETVRNFINLQSQAKRR